MAVFRNVIISQGITSIKGHSWLAGGPVDCKDKLALLLYGDEMRYSSWATAVVD